MQEHLRSDAHPTAAGRGRPPGARVALAAGLFAIAAASTTLAVADRASAKKERRPNVVVIMTDDQTAGSDDDSPFKERLGKLKRGRKSNVRAVPEMTDGRVVDLTKKVRGCR